MWYIIVHIPFGELFLSFTTYDTTKNHYVFTANCEALYKWPSIMALSDVEYILNKSIWTRYLSLLINKIALKIDSYQALFKVQKYLSSFLAANFALSSWKRYVGFFLFLLGIFMHKIRPKRREKSYPQNEWGQASMRVGGQAGRWAGT